MGDFPVIILDFETSGLSPQYGDRAIEIGAVLIEAGKVVDRFQRLMNPGFKINSFIASYTGISNAMLQEAAPCAEVMDEFADFIGKYSLVAHNASFDRKFLDAEFADIGRTRCSDMACTMLTARRVYPNAPNHKLGTLVQYCAIKNNGVFHRALADAEMTSGLWLAMIDEIKTLFGLNQVSFNLMKKLSKRSKAQASVFLKKAAKLEQ